MSSRTERAWDANVQAVIDAKAAIREAKVEWTEGLKARSMALMPLLLKQRRGIDLTAAEVALVAEHDARVKKLGRQARERRDDLEAARRRFKNAEGCR